MWRAWLLLVFLSIVMPALAQPTTPPTTQPTTRPSLRQTNPNALYPLLIKHEHAAYQRLIQDVAISEALREHVMDRSRAVQRACDDAIASARHEPADVSSFSDLCIDALYDGRGTEGDWRLIYRSLWNPRARVLRVAAYVRAVVEFDEPIPPEAMAKAARLLRYLDTFADKLLRVPDKDFQAEWADFRERIRIYRQELRSDPSLTLRCIDAELSWL